MHRFFLTPDLIQNDKLIFPKEIAYQISRVLRLEVGDHVQVLDGLGTEYLAEIIQIDPITGTGKVISSSLSDGEPKTKIHLIFALTQREKFEWILQKCTEIGVTSFTPMVTSRSLVQKSTEMESKYTRWQKIIQEAAEQSHRGIIPVLNPIINFHQLAANALGSTVNGLFLWEEEKQLTLKDSLAGISNKDVNVVIGPEGGFSPEEVVLAQKAGYVSVSLGKRILRVETAAIITCGLVLYQLD